MQISKTLPTIVDPREVISMLADSDFKMSSASRLERVKFMKDLSPEERQTFLDSFDQVFCDCDGVIWEGMGDPIRGSPEALDYLRRRGKRIAFVTNNTVVSMEEHLQKFRRYNIAVEKDDIVFPTQTICDYLHEIAFEGPIYCLASRAFVDVLRESGFQLVEDEEPSTLKNVFDLREILSPHNRAKAVVMDIDYNLSVAKLIRAQVHLKDPDCLFLAGAADLFVPIFGSNIIGPGLFMSVLERASQRQATVLGKPGKLLCAKLKSRYRLQDDRRALFIGDSLTSDMKFGKMCGFQTMLVLSGGTNVQDLEDSHDADEVPDYVVQSLADLLEPLQSELAN